MRNGGQDFNRIQECFGGAEVQTNLSIILSLSVPYSFVVVMSCSQVADGPSDHEFRGQDALAEGHSRMMQALEKHLHAGFADLFFVDADGRKRRGPQNGLLTVGQNHPPAIVPRFSLRSLQRSAK